MSFREPRARARRRPPLRPHCSAHCLLGALPPLPPTALLGALPPSSLLGAGHLDVPVEKLQVRAFHHAEGEHHRPFVFPTFEANELRWGRRCGEPPGLRGPRSIPSGPTLSQATTCPLLRATFLSSPCVGATGDGASPSGSPAAVAAGVRGASSCHHQRIPPGPRGARGPRRQGAAAIESRAEVAAAPEAISWSSTERSHAQLRKPRLLCAPDCLREARCLRRGHR